MDEQSKNNLDEKVGFLTRLKYAAIPATLTVAAFYTPEIKKRYDKIPENTKKNVERTALIGFEIAAGITTLALGVKLYNNIVNKNQQPNYSPNNNE